MTQVLGFPATDLGDAHGVLGSWFWAGPALAVVNIWNQQMEDSVAPISPLDTGEFHLWMD